MRYSKSTVIDQKVFNIQLFTSLKLFVKSFVYQRLDWNLENCGKLTVFISNFPAFGLLLALIM